jgi:hypothetical protein
MVNFDIVSPALTGSQTDIEGLRTPEDFDDLVRNIGQSLLESFLKAWPDYPHRPLEKTLYPPIHAGPVKGPLTIARRFEDFPISPTDQLFGAMVSPTTPGNIYALKGYQANVLTGVVAPTLASMLETQVFLVANESAQDTIAVRKRISRQIESVPVTGLAEYISVKRRPHRRHADKGRVMTAELYEARRIRPAEEPPQTLF